MKIFGYKDKGLSPDKIEPSELAEITLVANAEELRKITRFIDAAADGMETLGKNWEHEHLSDKFHEFESSPTFCSVQPRGKLMTSNPALNLTPFGRWTALKRRRLALR